MDRIPSMASSPQSFLIDRQTTSQDSSGGENKLFSPPLHTIFIGTLLHHRYQGIHQAAGANTEQ